MCASVGEGSVPSLGRLSGDFVLPFHGRMKIVCILILRAEVYLVSF